MFRHPSVLHTDTNRLSVCAERGVDALGCPRDALLVVVTPFLDTSTMGAYGVLTMQECRNIFDGSQSGIHVCCRANTAVIMQLVEENRIPEFDNLYLGTCTSLLH